MSIVSRIYLYFHFFFFLRNENVHNKKDGKTRQCGSGNSSTRRRRRAVKLISFDYSMLLLLCGLTWQSHVYRLCTCCCLVFVSLYVREHAPVCERGISEYHCVCVWLCLSMSVNCFGLTVTSDHSRLRHYTTFVRKSMYMHVTLANQSRIYSLTRSYTHSVEKQLVQTYISTQQRTKQIRINLT